MYLNKNPQQPSLQTLDVTTIRRIPLMEFTQSSALIEGYLCITGLPLLLSYISFFAKVLEEW